NITTFTLDHDKIEAARIELMRIRSEYSTLGLGLTAPLLAHEAELEEKNQRDVDEARNWLVGDHAGLFYAAAIGREQGEDKGREQGLSSALAHTHAMEAALQKEM
ncbi:MAG: hypothetical protein AAF182_03460, partial [Pseudomonadota bacterium]